MFVVILPREHLFNCADSSFIPNSQQLETTKTSRSINQIKKNGLKYVDHLQNKLLISYLDRDNIKFPE